MDNVSLLLFGTSPSSPPMCEKSSFGVFEYKLTSFMAIDSLVGDNNNCSWSLGISDNIHTAFVYNETFWWMSPLLFSFCLFFFYPITRHQSVLHYFSSSEVDFQNLLRVPPLVHIIYQSHLLFINYHHSLFIRFLNRYDSSFHHRIIR